MNGNQKAAFISFNYNLGRNFIENETKKMKKLLFSLFIALTAVAFVGANIWIIYY